ncbi:histidine phosphatase family protein [Enterococcus sp. HY326]|uniref:histidine phosphatase family protein n=1 Tax=Enterococcus sp. HY326 TaxID=2971265 RepID=UPI00223F246B|nr:histidine phosphatase family protein [Enterococcus sp. HY326]
MAELYFVRHGLTINNHEGRFNGSQSNPPLLPEGVAQARLLGEYLAKETFAKAYVSPLQRAQETLNNILLPQTDKPAIEVVDDLQEINFGDWDGLRIDEKQQEPEFHNLLHVPEKYNPTAFHGESFFDLAKRVKRFSDSLAYNNDEKYLIVAHGVTLMTLMQLLKGKTVADVREAGLLGNTSLSIFESNDGIEFQEKLWNFTDY